jgi:hypothetical protein
MLPFNPSNFSDTAQRRCLKGNGKKMKRIQRGHLGLGILAVAGAVAMIGAPYYSSAQRGRPVPGRIQTLTPYFLLQGEVSAVSGSLATVKTANYGPGLNHGSGIHSQAIVLGKTYLVDLSRARFQATDGTPVTAEGLSAGDKVVMLVNAKPGSPHQIGSTTVLNYTVHEVIRNNQTP